MDSGAPSEVALAERDANAPVVADAHAPRPAGPSFTVEPDQLAIDVVGAPYGQSPSYAARTDSTTLESGKPSMLLESTSEATANGFAATTATHPIDDTFGGRRYRMRAKVKTEEATSGWLWWRIDGPGGFYQIDNMGTPVDRRIRGTRNWQEVSLVMEVPKAMTGFAFGSGLTGPGKIWVGGITFEEVGTDVPTTPSFSND